MILLAGATGLVGGHVFGQLLATGQGVAVVGRRTTGVQHTGLTEILADFASLPDLPAADCAICALGTTMAQAGSREAFRAVDHAAVLAFFTAAQKAGVAHAIVITAIGSSPDAAAFYSRVKGEAERDIAALGFARLDIIQPGVIIGPRPDRRPMEAVLQWVAPMLDPLLVGRLQQIGAIKAEAIAQAIVALAAHTAPGRFVHSNRELRSLAAIQG